MTTNGGGDASTSSGGDTGGEAGGENPGERMMGAGRGGDDPDKITSMDVLVGSDTTTTSDPSLLSPASLLTVCAGCASASLG